MFDMPWLVTLIIGWELYGKFFDGLLLSFGAGKSEKLIFSASTGRTVRDWI